MVKPKHWLALIMLYTIVTLATVYAIPNDSPFVAIRFAVGFVFVVFFPGYCLINILFQGKNRLDPVETSVLSVALSFVLAGLVGLFLGLSPIRLSFLSITISMGALVLILAAVAFFRRVGTSVTDQSEA